MATPALDPQDFTWEPMGHVNGHDPRSYLKAQMRIDGHVFDVFAWEVMIDEEGVQRSVNPLISSDMTYMLSALYIERFHAVEIEGRPYFLFICPTGI